MNIIFFQNCVSPHQMSYISELVKLPEVDNVVFVAPRVSYSERTNMGWADMQEELVSRIEMHINPDTEEVQGVYEKFSGKETYCLYSGINDFVELTEWMKLGLKFSVKRGIITERPNVYWNKPLWLHKLRFLLRSKKYVKYFDYVFGIGDLAIDYYSTFSDGWKLIPFCYCTECNESEKLLSNENRIDNSEYVRLVFVGTVNKNKNVIAVLKSMLTLKNVKLKLDIIGDGPEKDNMERYANEHGGKDRVIFHGMKSMEEVYEMLPNYDVLVLPSKYDGWGAVVNEGLQRGLYVICSNKCGAQSLLTDSRIGSVFGNNDELISTLKYVSRNLTSIREDKLKRIRWADCISGKCVAEYMVNNLRSNTSVLPAWKNKL